MTDTNFTPRSALLKIAADDDLLSDPPALIAALRDLAAEIERITRPPALQRLKLPPQLREPETAWPWLLERFPWLFDGIAVQSEPYAYYLRKSQPQQDAEAIADLDNPSQADVAEVLFGDRTKTGGSYRRRILAALEATTTNQDDATTPQEQQKAA